MGVYLNHYQLLNNVGKSSFDDKLFDEMHSFVLKLYQAPEDIDSIDNLRGLQASSKSLLKLPPTKDSLRFHCLRVHYQTKVWLNSLIPKPSLGDLYDHGWRKSDSGTEPIFTTLEKFPTNLIGLSTCKCKKGSYYLLY